MPLSDARGKEVKEAFEIFDKEKSSALTYEQVTARHTSRKRTCRSRSGLHADVQHGRASAAQVGVLLRSLGMTPSDKDLADILPACDASAVGALSLKQTYEVLAAPPALPHTSPWCRAHATAGPCRFGCVLERSARGSSAGPSI